ncbi:hypothetical protein [Eleftheria terrae]|uniref:hypothetical protein n=1 Tax=Eleftheria terrae TaxID=1597781 RepID=UPI00263B93BA|nr:hypothetical protein [Eleftheria terrae]WKB51438.1 hypothetical protein N7L95_16710 [Eleftheria terrae]
MSAENPPSPPAAPRATPVRRLVLGWDGQAWRVVREQRLEQVPLPDPHAEPERGPHPCFWVEARDNRGRVYHRIVMDDPLPDSGSPPPHDRLLELLLPDLPEVSELHLVSWPGGTGQDEAAAVRRVLRLSRLPGSGGGGGGSGGTGQSSHSSGEPH